MFQELVNALGSRASGKAIDILRKIPHFRMLEDQFGAEYLSLMLPAVTPFILRAGLALLEERDQYVLIEGELEGRQPQFLVSRPLAAGAMIDLKERRG